MIKPVHDYVLVKPVKQETSAGGLILSETNQGVVMGVVEAVGPEVKDVKVGDGVMMKKFSGVEVKDKLMVKEEEILAKVEE